MNERSMFYTLKRYEEQLSRLMSKEDCAAFINAVATEAFRIIVEDFEDSDFKNFCLEHFNEIVGQEGEG